MSGRSQQRALYRNTLVRVQSHLLHSRSGATS
jgi:hypothetical protein